MANNGGGLIAAKSRGQGSARTGWGIMTGDGQAKEAMLDVKDERQYAPGSLLERFEKQDGGVQLIRDREKQREIVTATSEGT